MKKKYCPRCGNLCIEKEMNSSGCNDVECCGIKWTEFWCLKCEDTIELCLNEKPKYDIETGKLLTNK